MTANNQPTSGTESSVPGGGVTQPNPAQVAALQNMWAAMTALTQGHATPSSPDVAAPATTDDSRPADVGPAAAAPVTAAPAPVNASPSVPSATVFRSRAPWVVGALYHVVPAAGLIPIAEDGDEGLWYAIYRGLYVGITLNNALASAAVVGVSGSSMKGHKTQDRAVAAFNEMLDYNQVVVIQ
ncbi:hypothetical protein DFH06DRAFT_1122029 [Mycena polygramma]|nr:hypothetical protein DFH06DRAFT_1122029 [Mycena polygramma]